MVVWSISSSSSSSMRSVGWEGVVSGCGQLICTSMHGMHTHTHTHTHIFLTIVVEGSTLSLPLTHFFIGTPLPPQEAADLTM